ncbi:hypothetical protein NKH14_31945 [Mesorhizobium sp. M1380]|uniref:hypothetical protein n=1 Tax=Mesorhizobium sp. M1380 TaxID=2957093 RepID=UPI00333506A4
MPFAHVGEIESRIAAHDAATPKPSPVVGKDIAALAGDLRTVWSAPTTGARLKKRIVRTVIQEVVADIDDEASEIVLLIHWIGGVHTELRLPKRRRGQRNATSANVIAAIRHLVLIATEDLIAGILNRNGLMTGAWQSLDTGAGHCAQVASQDPGLASGAGRHRAIPQPEQGGAPPRRLTEDPQARLRIRRGQGYPSPAGWPMDLQAFRTWKAGSPADCSSRATEPQIPRGIASRSAKPIRFNDIDRWVL